MFPIRKSMVELSNCGDWQRHISGLGREEREDTRERSGAVRFRTKGGCVMIDTLARGKSLRIAGVWLSLGVAVGWMASGWSGSRIVAQGAANGLRAAPALNVQITGLPGESQWLTLVNPETQSLAVYRFEPNNPRGSLKLEAVRHFRWDMMLTEYQNQPPEVSSVESMTRGSRPKP